MPPRVCGVAESDTVYRGGKGLPEERSGRQREGKKGRPSLSSGSSRGVREAFSHWTEGGEYKGGWSPYRGGEKKNEFIGVCLESFLEIPVEVLSLNQVHGKGLFSRGVVGGGEEGT